MSAEPRPGLGAKALGALWGASLAALFVGHPVLDLVARHPAFLDAHRLGPAGIVMLALGATFVPALAAAALGAWLAGRRPARRRETRRRLPRPVTWWLTFLSPALVVVPAVFLLDADVRSRLATPDARPPAEVARPAPVVFLVLDELPLPVLLEDGAGSEVERRIDAARFPNFARLAATSHAFYGARSPYATTLPSVPAILTGRYAGDDLTVAEAESSAGSAAESAAEVCNLFTDLAGAYRLDVEERVTRLARGIHRPGLVRNRPPSPSLVVARDLAVLYLHRLLPESWSGGLPPVDQAWGTFGRREGGQHERGQRDPDPELDRTDPRVADFLAFVERLPAPADGAAPALSFFHADLPHRPWTLRLGPGLGEAALGEAGDLAAQTRVVDRLLGRLLDRMERLGLFDPAVLVVVADHGLGLRPGAGERGDPDRRVVFEEILAVPLFVKLPGQSRGHRHDDLVETVDLVPTLAETLGFEPACPPDGRSLFAEPRSWEETTFFRHRGWSARP